jgi:type IV pilus assembly protein PilA
MNKLNSNNEKGFALVELLATLVILGIISSIALVSIVGFIGNSKDKTFINNAYSLRHAAYLYLNNDYVLKETTPPGIITYKDLYDRNYINEFEDPYTGRPLHPSEKTYVVVTNGKVTAVCLKGENRNLCSKSGMENAAIPLEELSVDLITFNN